MAQTYKAGSLNITVEGEDAAFTRSVTVSSPTAGVQELHIRLKGPVAAMPKPITVKFKQPSVDIQAYLAPYGADAKDDPTSLYNYEISRMIPVSFLGRSIFTSAMMDQPSMTFVNTAGQNRLTIATSELVYPNTFRTGLNEDGGVGFEIGIGLFDYPTKPVTDYSVTIRLDHRDIFYNTAQKELLQWWKTTHRLTFAPIPAKAHLPFYCTWYALKADGMNAAAVEQQARLAKALGCETIIADDGWQKPVNAKAGYFEVNGDWEVAREKFPDFRSHVKKVQDMGLSYMLWIGPSMIGEKTAAYQALKDKMLVRAGWATAWVPDPRFPEVRQYLLGRFTSLLKETGIDGFKIDFMDMFNSRYAGKELAQGGGRDFSSVEEAALKLIADIYEACRAIKPEVLIEFRQFYTNPLLQQYATMFRAIDCPNDAMENRTRTLDARNLNAQIIHADPLTWNEQETPAQAARQFLHTFLSVPQVSTDLTKMNGEQKKMLTFLLKIWTEFNGVLTQGTATNYGPEAHYTWSESSLNAETVIIAYQSTILNPKNLNKKTLLVNGTHASNLVFDLTKDFGLRNVTVYTCTGEAVRKAQVRFKGLVKVEVPASGLIRIDE